MADVLFYNNIDDGFFNAVNYDRTYNADDLCEWLSSTNSNGVVPEPTGQLKVTASDTGNLVRVATGKGLIEGHILDLTSIQDIPIETAPTNTNYFRIDLVGMRTNYVLRRCELFYRSGTLNSEAKPLLNRDENYYEMALGYIRVKGGTITQVTQADIEDAREFVFSTATIFQQLSQVVNVTATTTSIPITVKYNSRNDIVNVSVNGKPLTRGTQYNINNDIVQLVEAVYAGNTIEIQVWHFRDAAGLEKIDINNTEAVVQEINKYYYYCNGVDDNIKLSDIAQHFLAGTDEYAGINTNAQMELIICGTAGISSNYSGDGSQARPYTFFAFGRSASSTRTIYFNFSNCSRINVSCNNGTDIYSTIFSGADINIRNVALNVAAGYNVNIFDGVNVHCQDSEFWMTTTNDCCVGNCCGFFENVRTSITSISGNAFCFNGNGNLTRVIGGTHYCWTANSAKEAVCFYVEAYQTENVLFVQMANIPQNTRSGYRQTDTIKVNSGYATIMSNAMWKAASVYNVDNCIRYGNVIISKN